MSSVYQPYFVYYLVYCDESFCTEDKGSCQNDVCHCKQNMFGTECEQSKQTFIDLFK